MKVRTGQLECTSIDDGYLYLSRCSDDARLPLKTRYSYVPVVSLEVTTPFWQLRTFADTSKAKAGKSKAWWEITAQRFGEMLGAVQRNVRGVKSEEMVDQEVRARQHLAFRSLKLLSLQAFSIAIKHTSLTIASIDLPAKYITGVRRGIARLGRDDYVYYRQTAAYDLSDEGDRKDAVRALMRLFTYLASGAAKIRRVQLVMALTDDAEHDQGILDELDEPEEDLDFEEQEEVDSGRAAAAEDTEMVSVSAEAVRSLPDMRVLRASPAAASTSRRPARRRWTL